MWYNGAHCHTVNKGAKWHCVRHNPTCNKNNLLSVKDSSIVNHDI